MHIPIPARLSGEALECQQTRIATLIHALARADAGLPVAHEHRAEIVDYRRAEADLVAIASEITGRADFRSAATSSDFAAAFSEGLKLMLLDTWQPAAAPLQSLARQIPLTDFRATDVITVEMPALIEADEDTPTVFSKLAMRTLPGCKLRVFESCLKVSRQVMSTLGAALVNAVAGLARELLALETRLAVEALSAVPVTPGVNTGIGAGYALSEMSISDAFDYFDAQHMRPAGVFVGESVGMTVRKILTQAGVPLPVIHCPALATGSVYFIADPVARPALIRLYEFDRLPGAPAPTVGWQKIPRSDAYGYYCRHSVAYAPGDERGLYAIGVS